MSGDDREPGRDDDGPGLLVYVTDVVGSAGAVVLVGLLLFSVSGVWPPLVAIESPSMDPHIEKGDLVFVMEEERFPGRNATHGVVTAHRGGQYVRFSQPGDVIVYAPDGMRQRTPIIHRAMFYVEDGENWVDRANPEYLGAAESCEAVRTCPAPHAGFITKGDNNGNYDQVGSNPISGVVRPAWVVGTAEWRVPVLGQIRLGWNRAAAEPTGQSTESVNSTGENATAP
ncbi:S26 family signal peptidase [Haloarcula litorea]|uniref:S26 family signal peptidase n=1 Tax=Haloarcula litorea TaxID=3032579 RepID=UPI0023E7DF7D|nr:S26 family signal peptidase [Halomicroarcula sp. GDY20]